MHTFCSSDEQIQGANLGRKDFWRKMFKSQSAASDTSSQSEQDTSECTTAHSGTTTDRRSRSRSRRISLRKKLKLPIGKCLSPPVLCTYCVCREIQLSSEILQHSSLLCLCSPKRSCGLLLSAFYSCGTDAICQRYQRIIFVKIDYWNFSLKVVGYRCNLTVPVCRREIFQVNIYWTEKISLKIPRTWPCMVVFNTCYMKMLPFAFLPFFHALVRPLWRNILQLLRNSSIF